MLVLRTKSGGGPVIDEDLLQLNPMLKMKFNGKTLFTTLLNNVRKIVWVMNEMRIRFITFVNWLALPVSLECIKFVASKLTARDKRSNPSIEGIYVIKKWGN